MRYAIHHRGVPIASAEVPNEELLGSVVMELLPAFEAVRPAIATMWQDGNPDAPVSVRDAEATAVRAQLELWDETGAWLPTAAIELVVTGPQTAAAFIRFEEITAPVAACIRPAPRRRADSRPTSE